MQIEEKIIQFLFIESILIYILDLQYRVKFPSPNIFLRESQGHTQLSVVVDGGAGVPKFAEQKVF